VRSDEYHWLTQLAPTHPQVRHHTHLALHTT
jgi:hypothetical protein